MTSQPHSSSLFPRAFALRRGPFGKWCLYALAILAPGSLPVLVVVWLFLRKKKLNSLNKVAELFNKQSTTITVLVDNNTNDLKVE